MDRDLSLWDFAVALYARPGVEAACLTLQDDHGQCVDLLLWRLWALGRRIGAGDLARAATLARDWEGAVTAPLRAARRALAAPAAGIADSARLVLRGQVKAAELAAERLLLEALEAATPRDPAPPVDVTAALAALAAAWGASAPDAVFADLAAAAGSVTG